MVKRALGVLLIAVLASSLSVLTTGLVVNAYIQSVLASFDIKLDSPISGITGMVNSITGMNNKNSPLGKTSDTGSVADTPQSKDGKDSSADKEKEAGENVLEDALPVMGSAQEESAASGIGGTLDQQLVMTPEEMSELKENLPSGEKVDIFNILMAKLPQDEMQKISTAMEDGLTQDEVEVIQESIAKYVDKEEYDILMKMLTPTPETGQ